MFDTVEQINENETKVETDKIDYYCSYLTVFIKHKSYKFKINITFYTLSTVTAL